MGLFRRDQHGSNVEQAVRDASDYRDAIDRIARIEVFPTSKDEVSDADSAGFMKSIDDLATMVKEEMGRYPDRFNVSDIDKVDDDLKAIATRSHGKEKVEPETHDDLPNIDGTTDRAEADAREMKEASYKEDVKDFFPERVRAANEVRIGDFRRQMFVMTIMDTDKGNMVQTQEDLNKAIEQYLERQYGILQDYLVNVGLMNATERKRLFSSEDHTRNVECNDVFSLFEQHVKSLRNAGEYGDRLSSDFIGSRNAGTANLYKAVSAYINVRHIDDMIDRTMSGFISRDADMDGPIVIETKDEGTRTVYKYRHVNASNNQATHWGVEDHDALDEMGGFTQCLISSIPLVNMDNGPEAENAIGVMTPQFLLNATSVLLRAARSSAIIEGRTGDNDPVVELHNLAIGLQNRPQQMKRILELLFDHDRKAEVKKALESRGLTNTFMNHLYSVYVTVFKGIPGKTAAWLDVENAYVKGSGFLASLSPTQAIVNAMTANVSMEYVETGYNVLSGRSETQVKSRYNSDQYMFNIRSKVNGFARTILPRENVMFSIRESKGQDGNNVYEVLRNDGTTLFSIRMTENDDHLLNKKDEEHAGRRLTITGVDRLAAFLDGIQLNGARDIDDFVNQKGRDASQDEKTLYGLMSFVDATLGTSFTKSVEGVNEFYMYMSQYGLRSEALQDLLVVGARSLRINQMYRNFQDAMQRSGKYDRFNIKKYLLDNPNEYMAFNLGAVSRYVESKYFQTSGLSGTQLTTTSPSSRWVVSLGRAQCLLEGNLSNPTVRFRGGQRYPNYVPYFMGSDYARLFDRESDESASGHLLFRGNKGMISGVFVDSEVVTSNGIVKMAKGMNAVELFTDKILNKFVDPICDKGTVVYLQPTTFADKKKPLVYGVDLDRIRISGKSLRSWLASQTRTNEDDFAQGKDTLSNAVARALNNTVGRAYRQVYDNVLGDYGKVWTMMFPGSKPLESGAIRNQYSRLCRWLESHTQDDLVDIARRYNEEHPDDPVVFYDNTHYRVVDGRLRFNETLWHYARVMYPHEMDIAPIRERLRREQVNFVNLLIQNFANLTFDTDNNGRVAERSSLGLFFRNVLGMKATDTQGWVDGNSNAMVLGRVVDKNGRVVREVTHRKLVLGDGERLVLNPLLNAYFMTNVLVGNNIRMLLTGSEIAHKPAALKSQLKAGGDGSITAAITAAVARHNERGGVQVSANDVLNTITDNGASELSHVTMVETMEYLARGDENLNDHEQAVAKATRDVIMDAYGNLMYELEASGQLTQIKRNVIATATINQLQQDNLVGIPDMMNVAVTEDIQALVYNYAGQKASMDSSDGMALEAPMMHYWDNGSFGENALGNIWKPIHHHYDGNYMQATLLKYAIDVMTNQWMRQSEGNDPYGNGNGVPLRNLFRKMTDIRWHKAGWNGRVDVVNDQWSQERIDLVNGCAFKEDSIIDFNDNIIQGNKVYYNDGKGAYWMITGFGIEDGVYYTMERRVNINGGDYVVNGEKPRLVRVYHYFDNNGMHVKSSTLRPDADLHTVDSLYELHSVFGGIYSMSKEDGMLRYSEASNAIVAMYANYVTIARNEGENLELTQENYYQPLKHMLVHLVANKTAVKNGGGNINNAARYYDDVPLAFMRMRTDVYGSQLNSDHTADDSRMTEFSQVISAMDAGGRYHSQYASQVYRMLGKVALNMSGMELDAVDEFRGTEKGNANISRLYDVIGRTIINSYAYDDSRAGLTSRILINISRAFNLNADHGLDEFKIPFSDANLHSQILPAVIGAVNGKSIKRKFPGVGAVISGGYDISMVYDVDGRVMQFLDVLNLARSERVVVDTENVTDVAEINRRMVAALLGKRQERQPWTMDASSFRPEDNVVVRYRLDGEEKEREMHITLHDIDEYYGFIHDPVKVILERLVGGMEDLVESRYDAASKTIEYRTGRQVKGRRLSIADRKDDGGTTVGKDMRFARDVTRPRNLAPQRMEWDIVRKDANGAETVRHMCIYQAKAVEEAFTNMNRSRKETSDAVQKVLDDLEKGTYVEDGVTYEVRNLDVSEAEIIMSNIYMTKFGLKPSDTLPDVLGEGQSGKRFSKSFKQPQSANYDLAFIGRNRRDTYIVFRPLASKGVVSRNMRSTMKTDTSAKGRNDKYAYHVVSRDNVPLFQVARDIIDTSVVYDQASDTYRYASGDNKGQEVANRDLYSTYEEDGKTYVLRHVEFVHRKRVTEGGVKKDVYQIDRNALVEAMAFPEDVSRDARNRSINNMVATILKGIYDSRDYKGIAMSTQLQDSSFYTLLNTMTTLASKFEHNDNVRRLLYEKGSRNCYWALLMETYAKEHGNTGRSLDRMEDMHVEGEEAQGRKEKVHALDTTKMGDVIRAFNNRLNSERFSSFQKAQEFVVARIPAQDLQSFMSMRNVGFTGSTNAFCYVSHWQFWLQGNDVDIDKAYALGMCFDSNGRYVNWSNLFDYSSYETLLASETLPYPDGKTVEVKPASVEHASHDITDGIMEIRRAEAAVTSAQERYAAVGRRDKEGLARALKDVNDAKAVRVRAYASLLKALDDDAGAMVTEDGKTKVYVTATMGNGNEGISERDVNDIVWNLNRHYKTRLPYGTVEEANKNFVSANLQRSVGALRNSLRAYTPLTMDDTREGAKLSSKGQQLSALSLMNPLSVLMIQHQAISGRDSTGIAANGEKASFLWHYCFNEALRRSGDKDFDQMVFDFTTHRIMGRHLGVENCRESTQKALPDINLEGVSQEKIDRIREYYLTPDMPAGLTISQYISLATDNMKEMVLPNINASMLLMKCHLFLVNMGYDVKDIIRFMTCPVVSMINDLTVENMFNNAQYSVKDACAIVGGDLRVVLGAHLSTAAYNHLLDACNIRNDEMLDHDTFMRKVVPYIVKCRNSGYNGYVQLANAYNDVMRIDNLMTEYGLKDADGNMVMAREDVDADVNEFMNVMDAANEFSMFGTILGLNQGLPPTKVELESLRERLQRAYSSATYKDTTIASKYRMLDIQRFVRDADYREGIIDAYGRNKKCLNIFKCLADLPQFDAILRLLDMELTVDHNISIRSKAFDRVVGKAGNPTMTEGYRRRLLDAISGQLIMSFIRHSGQKIVIPYKAGTILLDSACRETKASRDGFLRLDRQCDVATFKHYMENVLIPNLKVGRYTVYANGKFEDVGDPGLHGNRFLNDIIEDERDDMRYMKMAMDMNRILDNQYGMMKYDDYVDGLQRLQEIELYEGSGITVADLFALYNIVTHKNKYGRNNMTILFDYMVRKGSGRLMQDYLAYVGETDYNGRINEKESAMAGDMDADTGDHVIDLYFLDAMMQAAPFVNTLKGQKDPYVKMRDADGNVTYYRKNVYDRYQEYNESSLPRIPGETSGERMQRAANQLQYFVLGGTRSGKTDYYADALRGNTEEAFSVVQQLMSDGILRITKVC